MKLPDYNRKKIQNLIIGSYKFPSMSASQDKQPIKWPFPHMAIKRLWL
jgi:hypothetical protein